MFLQMTITARSLFHHRFVLSPVIALIVPALVWAADPAPGTVLTGTNTINGGGESINGNGGTGYFVKSGTLTINDATLTNFSTKGGDGSGGGAGLGGAVFVNSGATLILNNVDFGGNTATGGKGGVGDAGGSLNNLFNNGSSVSQAGSGYTPEQTSFTDIEGTTGTKGANGSFNTNGIGGAGGNGGAGGSGGDRSISLILGVTSASLDLAAVISELVAASSNPFTANVAIGLGAQVASAGINLGNAVAALAYFDQSLADGQIGLGGTGASGGDGGLGGFGYGGGTGGDGGSGGTGGSNWGGSAYKGGAAGGDAGDGGSGGIGGFGAGGGRGGDGGTGGGGAGVTATAGSPAVPAVTHEQIVPAVYSKGYYIDNDSNPATADVFVELEGSLSAAITPYSFDHDSNAGTPDVTVQTKITSPETSITIIDTPAQPAIAASAGGQRPNGKTGSGGDGGEGGFGAGQGAGGAGSTAKSDGGNGGNGYGGAIFVRDDATLIIQGNATFGGNNVRGGSGEKGDSDTTAGLSGIAVGSDIYMMTGSTVVLDAGEGNVITFRSSATGSIADDSAASMVPAGGTSAIASGEGAGLTVQSGLVIFEGANFYSGQTKIAGGVLQAIDGEGIYVDSNINLAGGVFQSNGDFIRYVGTGPTQIQWTGSGGFAAVDGDLTVSLNHGLSQAAATQTWASGSFVTNGSALLFGSTSATDKVTFVNNINLNNGNRTILVKANEDNSDHAILTGVLSNGSLTVGNADNTGVLILKGVNTYAGGTTVNGGSLVLEGNGKLNANGNVTVNAGGTFDISQTGDQSVGDLGGASGGVINLGDNVLTVNQGGNTTFAGALNDGGIAGGTGAGLTKNGAGELTLSGTNGYTGTTQVNAGTLKVTGSLGSRTVNVATGATLNDVNSGLHSEAALTNAGTTTLGANDTVASYVSNAGTLNGAGKTLTAATYALNNNSTVDANLGAGAVTANGTVALNGTSAATTVTVETGTTTLGSAERLLDTTDLTIASGATLVLGGAEKIGTLDGAGSLQNNGGRLTADDGSFSGVLSGTGGLTKVSDGKLTLTGANTYTGSTQIDAGTVELSGSGSLVSDTVNIESGATLDNLNGGLASNATVNNDGTLNIAEADDTIATLNNTGTVNGTATLTATTYNLNEGSEINANLGTGTVNANGAVALNGTSNAETVNIQTGTTTLGSAERLREDTDLTVSSGAILVLGGNEKIGTFDGAGTTALGEHQLTVDDGTYSGVVTGTGGIDKVSSGTLVLSGDSTYTGSTNVNAGTLTLTGTLESLEVNVAADTTFNNMNGGLAQGATLNNDGTTVLDADDTITTLNNTGTLDGAPNTLTAETYNLNDGSVINANLGTGVVNANGAVALNGTSNAETVNIQTGTTTLGSTERLRDDTDLTISADATLVLGGDEKIGTLEGFGSLQNAGGLLTVDDGEFSGVISGTGGLTKVSGGELVLSGANTYTGSTVINAGSLYLDGSLVSNVVTVDADAELYDIFGGLADDTVLTVNGYALLAANDAVDTLNGSGEVELVMPKKSEIKMPVKPTSARLTVNQGYFEGVISGTGGLTKVSSGNLLLSGANTYTGSTRIDEGAVDLEGSLVSNVVTVAAPAELYVYDGGLASDTTLTVDGFASFAGDDAIATLNGSGEVELHSKKKGMASTRLTVDNGEFSGVISGSGGLTKVSDGELVLSGANTYIGSTEIDAGKITLTGSLGSLKVNVASGATLSSTTAGLSADAMLTNAGTVDLGDADDTVATFNSTGELNGTATLTAEIYNLEGGSVINANLGAGTLNVTNGTTVLAGTSAAESVNIEFGGTLTLNLAERLIDTAAVYVAGTLNLSGGNETIKLLTGDGTININTYKLTVTHGGAFTGTLNASSLVSDGGDLVLDGGTTTNESTTVSNGGSLEVTNGGTLNSTDGITVEEDSDLVVDSTGTVNTTTITVQADGQLTLNTGYTLSYDTLTGDGFVETNGGTFTNAGGSTVKGFLTFSDDFTNNGTFAPGNSPGVTVIAGNYIEAGTLESEFENTTPITGHDQVRVGGTVTISPGATLVVQTFNGALPARGDVFQIISDLAGGAKVINGTFDAVLFDVDGDAGPGAAVNSAAVVFDVATGRLIATGLNTPGSTFADLGANGNQGAAATAIFGVAQNLVGSNQVDTSLVSGPGFFANQLIDATGSPQADLARYTPDYYGALADYAFTGDRALARRVQDRVSVTSDLSGSGSARGGAFAGMIDTNADTADNATVDRTDYFAGGDFVVVPGFKAGVVVSTHEGDISAPLGTAEADGIGGLVYARYALSSKLTAFGTLGYSTQDYDLRRSTVNGTVTGSTDATSFTGSAGVQHQGWTKGRLSVAPRLALVYSQSSVDGFTETGAIDALENDGYDSTLITGEAGVSALWSAPVLGRMFNVELNLGLEQVLVDDNDNLDVRVASTPAIAYPVKFADDASTRVTYGLNVGYNVFKQATVYAGYEGRTGDGSSHYINLGVRVGF
jgi:autotransporter-associated beta strand protein